MMLSDCVWLHVVCEYCSFSTVLTLGKVSQLFMQISNTRVLKYLQGVHKQQRQLILNDVLKDATRYCFEHNVWEDDSLSDTSFHTYHEKATLNELIQRATTSYLITDVRANKYTKLIRNCYAHYFTPLQFIVKLMERAFPEFGGTTISDHAHEVDVTVAREKILEILLDWVEHDLVVDFQFYHPDNYKELIIDIVQPFIHYMTIFDYKSGCAARKSLVKCWNKMHDSKGPELLITEKTDLLSYSVEEIAHVLTIVDAVNLSRIPHTEFSGERIQERKTQCPQISNLFEAFHKGTHWIVRSILSFSDPIMRDKCIEKFMRLALHLFQINNFNSYHMIHSGLSMASVCRLVKNIDSVVQYKFDALVEKFYPEWKYGRLLRAMQQEQQEYLPFAGRIVTACVFNSESYQKECSSFVIVPKLEQLSDIIEQDFRPYRFNQILSSKPYVIEKSLKLWKMNTQCVEYDEEVMYQRSLQLQPRKRSTRKPAVDKAK